MGDYVVLVMHNVSYEGLLRRLGYASRQLRGLLRRLGYALRVVTISHALMTALSNQPLCCWREKKKNDEVQLDSVGKMSGARFCNHDEHQRMF